MNLIPRKEDGSYILVISKGLDMSSSRYTSQEEAMLEARRKAEVLCSNISNPHMIHETKDTLFIVQGPICLYHM
jgi:hypothetical protein